MAINLQAALDGITAAGRHIIGDGRAALDEVQVFTAALAVDTGPILEAAALAAATGGDVETWTRSIAAQVDAVALRTLAVTRKLELESVQRMQDAALAALHTVLAVAIVA